MGSKTAGVAISDPLGFTARLTEIIPIHEEKGEFGLFGRARKDKGADSRYWPALRI